MHAGMQVCMKAESEIYFFGYTSMVRLLSGYLLNPFHHTKKYIVHQYCFALIQPVKDRHFRTVLWRDKQMELAGCNIKACNQTCLDDRKGPSKLTSTLSHLSKPHIIEKLTVNVRYLPFMSKYVSLMRI